MTGFFGEGGLDKELAKELVLDIFYDAVECQIPEISLREILRILGVNEKKIKQIIDKEGDMIYDMTGFTKDTIAEASNAILLRDNTPSLI